MKILYIAPASDWGPDDEELKRRQKILQGIACSGTSIECICVREGPGAVRTLYDGYKSAPYLIRDIIKAEEQGYDAIIIGGAPLGIDGAREQVKISVIGPSEISLVIASLLARKFSIIAVSGGERAEDYVNSVGLGAKLASVRTIGKKWFYEKQMGHAPPTDIEGAKKIVIEVCRKAIEEDGAKAIVLSGMSMGFLGISDWLHEQLGVPVISQPNIAFKFAEMLVSLGLTYSK